MIIAPLDYERYAVFVRPLQELEAPQAMARSTPRQTEPVDALRTNVDRFDLPAGATGNPARRSQFGALTAAGGADFVYPVSQPSSTVSGIPILVLENVGVVVAIPSRAVVAYEFQPRITGTQLHISG